MYRTKCNLFLYLLLFFLVNCMQSMEKPKEEVSPLLYSRTIENLTTNYVQLLPKEIFGELQKFVNYNNTIHYPEIVFWLLKHKESLGLFPIISNSPNNVKMRPGNVLDTRNNRRFCISKESVMIENIYYNKCYAQTLNAYWPLIFINLQGNDKLIAYTNDNRQFIWDLECPQMKQVIMEQLQKNDNYYLPHLCRVLYHAWMTNMKFDLSKHEELQDAYRKLPQPMQDVMRPTIDIVKPLLRFWQIKEKNRKKTP